MTTLEMRKQVLDPRAEKLFYNPIFQGELGHTLNVTKSCAKAGVYTYGQLLDEVAKRDTGSPHCRNVTNLFDRIAVTDLEKRQHHLLITVEGNVPFQKVSQRLLYAQLLKLNYRDHHSSAKWGETTSFVWEQIHLNMYTTHSYNKWHRTTLGCPLCTQPIQDEFHIIFDCPVVISLWAQIEPLLLKLGPTPVTEQEKIFGILVLPQRLPRGTGSRML